MVNGRLHFVIAIEIGATMTIDDVTEDELRAVLAQARVESVEARRHEPVTLTPNPAMPYSFSFCSSIL